MGRDQRASECYRDGIWCHLLHIRCFGSVDRDPDPRWPALNSYRSLWKASSANARGSLTRVSKGGKTTDYSYDDRGYLTGIKAANIINAHYSHTNKGNLEYRIDSLTNQREDFLYDDLNRLTNWNVTQAGVVTSNSLTYDDAGPVSFGNMVAKSDLGDITMHYDLDGRPHSLDSISGVLTSFPLDNLSVTYTGFKKIATLSEGTNHYTVTYGVDNQRRKSVHQVNGVTTLTRYYVGNYEEEIDASGNVRKIHYISGGDGLAAILISDHGLDSLYYAYTDLLGSLTTLTDANGNVLERFAYDPWGKRRNPSDWTQVDEASTRRVNRGYTMHEHLDAFLIINMNGRVYDPLTAQFFSPDPFVQAPGNWLNYNRYSYCYNNPFRYTDPSGEIILLAAALIGVGVGIIVNYGIQVASNYAQGYRGPDAWINKIDWIDVAVSGVVGGVSAGAGVGVTASSSIGKSLIKFAGSTAWKYINLFGVSLISSSFDLTWNDGFRTNSYQNILLNYVSSIIFNHTSQVSSEFATSIFSGIGSISKDALGKYALNFGKEWFIGTVENILYNSSFVPIIEENYMPPYYPNSPYSYPK